MTERWTVAMGDNFHFDIVKAEPRGDEPFGTDADLNGTYETKLAALEYHIACQNDTRAALMHHLARAKRMRNRLVRSLATPPSPALNEELSDG